VRSAELLARRGERSLDGSAIAHVELGDGSLAAGALDLLARFLRTVIVVKPRDGDARALGGKRDRSGLPDARIRSRDDRDAAAQTPVGRLARL
jgi:hypothetical protein